MKLVLPYPPSANRYWRNWRGRMVVSEEARQYKEKVHLRKFFSGDESEPTSGEVMVTMLFYRPAKRGDLDNRIKVTLDALRGIAFNDDSQVTRIVAARFEDKNNPRVEVTVEAA